MMAVTSFPFRFGRSLALRLPYTVMLMRTEYDRAMLAARYYDSLKNRSRAEPRRLGMDASGISRALFEAVYNESPNAARRAP